MGAGEAIFEGGFKFASSETTNKLDITASEYQVQLGSNQWIIGEIAIKIFLVTYEK